MPDTCIELHFWWFVGIVSRYNNIHLKETISIRGIGWTIYKPFPMSNVVVNKGNYNSRIFSLLFDEIYYLLLPFIEILELLIQSVLLSFLLHIDNLININEIY
jgi:hypothetical protein